MDNQNNEQYQMSAPEEPKPARKLKKLMPIIIAVVIVLATVTTFAATVGAPAIRSITLSPEEHYRYIEMKALTEGMDTTVALMKTTTETPAGSGSMALTVSDDFIEFANDMLMIADIEDYIGDVRNINIEYQFGSKDDLYGASAVLKLGESQIAEISAIANVKTGLLYISFPGLSEGVLEIDLENELGSDFDEILKSYDSADIISILNSVLSDSKKTNELLSIVETALNKITSVNKQKDVIQVDGIEQECTVFTIEIDEDMIEDIVTAGLKAIQNSEIFDEIIYEFLPLLETMNDDFTMSKAEVSEHIDETIDMLLDDLYIEDFEMTYVVYVDSKENIIGRYIETEDMNISLMSAQDGKDYAFEYILEETYFGESEEIFNISGEGTKKGDKFTGDITLSMEGMKFLKIAAEDFAYEVKDQSYSGKLTFSTAKGLNELVSDELPFAIASLIKTLELEFDFDIEKSSSKVAVTVEVSRMTVGEFTFEYKKKSDYTPKTPSRSDIYDGDLEEFFSDFDLDALIDRLDEAGIPTDQIF